MTKTSALLYHIAATDTPDAYEAEFIAFEGKTHALLPLRTEQLMVLHYEPVPAAA